MPPRKKKPAAGSQGLAADELASAAVPKDLEELARRVEADGGSVLTRYRDPFGGRWLLLAALPLDKVQPTPYQRELSETHVKHLTDVIPKVGRFLDPVIAVAHDEGYWTPNGMHRLHAMRALGAKAIVVLLVPEPEVAFRILALNTEKAHNLKDKSLEAMRMERGLAASPDTAKRPESDWAFEFEEPAYLTVGLAYEERPRLAGAVYMPVLRRCEEFSQQPISKAIRERMDRARRVLELDDAVTHAVGELKDAGFKSPYLRPFVVARINPLRFAKPTRVGQKAPRANFDTTLDRMIDRAHAFEVGKVRAQDIAVMGGAAPAVEE